MLTDEQIISIRRYNDCILKLIELVRLTCNDKEASLVFRNFHKVKSMEEKTLYLLFVYINNCDESYLVILKDTEIIPNDVIDDFLENGIAIDNLNSDIVKDYLIKNVTIDASTIIENINNERKKDKKENKVRETYVDYNLNHLEKDNFKSVELRNLKLKRKVRRKILYDKYQREF